MTRRLRVASYNIRKSIGTDRRRDPMRVLDVINRLEADVVALQEVDRRLGNRPTVLARERIAEETDFVVADLARNDVSLGWHGNAVLVKKGLTIHGVSHITLPGFEPRGAVQVDVGNDSARLSLVGAHLGLLRPDRRAQLAAIRAHLADQDLPNSVILGDFNEWSPTKGLEALSGDFDVVSPGKSYHSAYPLAGLDRVALGRRICLLNAGVDESELAKVASDHLPIWGEIEIGPENE